MASPTKEMDPKGLALTEREIEILGKAWKCMKTQPEVDYAKLAAECGMNNVGSASNAWGRIKKKLFSDMPAAAGPAASGGAAPATPAGRKRKSVAITAAAAAVAVEAPNADSMAAVDDESGEVGDVDGGVSVANDAGENADNAENENGTIAFTPINGTPKRRRGGGTPRTPRTPKTPKTPKAPKTPKTAGAGRGRGRKAAVKTEVVAPKPEDEDTELDDADGGVEVEPSQNNGASKTEDLEMADAALETSADGEDGF